ncbi:hypothetical protein [Paenibacillus sp. GM2]|uniref:hypothetical protein n=1 Tax=Paenibacillus sp. GM2 TaxID=1622070 RepID=UPI000838DE97|nr:hypothetical protein [Paenibacillus sp. GM2]
MTEKVPCQSEGCTAMILPTTAAKTGGYCMPCHQEQERRKREAYILQHRKTVNLYEGLNDPVEILKIMHSPRQYDPLIKYTAYPRSKEQVYASLSPVEAQSMAVYALNLLGSGDEDTSRDILSSLMCFRDESIADGLPLLLEHEVYYPGILYRDAGPEVRDRLFDQVEWDDENRNYILLALAWIGDEQVVRRFHEWRMKPPQWAEQLHVVPELYAREAGWKLSDSGQRRDLFQGSSYAVEKREDPRDLSVQQMSSGFLKYAAADCPWCGGKLTRLVDVDTSHTALAKLNLPWERLQVDTCVICGCYGIIYMELDGGGMPSWSAYNRKPAYLPDIKSEEYSGEYLQVGPQLTLSDIPRSSCYAAIWELDSHSKFGGYPGWVQDAEYPDCPCCGRSMLFIGQLDWSDLEDYGEGIYYMFFCPKDRITATTYQQS